MDEFRVFDIAQTLDDAAALRAERFRLAEQAYVRSLAAAIAADVARIPHHRFGYNGSDTLYVRSRVRHSSRRLTWARHWLAPEETSNRTLAERVRQELLLRHGVTALRALHLRTPRWRYSFIADGLGPLLLFIPTLLARAADAAFVTYTAEWTVGPHLRPRHRSATAPGAVAVAAVVVGRPAADSDGGGGGAEDPLLGVC